MTALFIVGAPRSGTTLARNILRSFDGIYLPPDEFQILPAFLKAAENGASAADMAALVDGTVFADHMRRRGVWPGAAQITSALEGKSPAGALQALVLALAAQEGVASVSWWGDKTPENIFHLGLIDRHWPDSRVLHVARDPRSTVLSMHRSWGRSLLRGAVIWRDAVRAAEHFRNAAGTDRMRTLPYEHLTDDPDPELRDLADWLGIPFDPAAFENVSSEERWGGATGARGVQRRTADWEQALSEPQIRLIEEICFDEMRLLGFEPRFAKGPKRPGALALKMAKTSDAVRVLRSYARERGWPAAISYKLRQWRSMRQA